MPKLTSPILLIATTALLVIGSLVSNRSTSAEQGKGGEVIAKPTPIPSQAPTKRSAPARTTNKSKTNQPAESASEAALKNYKFLFSFRHDDIVTCAAFSHDGRLLAAGSEKGTIIVVDVTTQEKHVIEGLYPNGNGVNVVGFSQDGQFLLTGGWGILNDQNTGLIKILRASDYSVLQTLDAHRGHSVDFLRISNDDNWLISADDSTINVWDLKEGRVKWHLPRLDSGLAFDGQRTLFLGMSKVTDGLPDSNITGLRGRRRGIVFIDILEGKVTRAIASLGSELIRRIAVSSANAELVALAQTDSGYFVQVIDGKTDRIMKTISVKPYQPEPGWQLLGVPRIDFELAQNHPVVVYNDRRATYFIDYKSGKKEDFDHRSMIGFAFDRTGERFAILGGIKNQALTGQPEQDYWTVSIFSFKPVWEN